jgi:hypothetical protein
MFPVVAAYAPYMPSIQNVVAIAWSAAYVPYMPRTQSVVAIGSSANQRIRNAVPHDTAVLLGSSAAQKPAYWDPLSMAQPWDTDTDLQ